MRLPEGTRSLTALSSRYEPEVMGTQRHVVGLLTTLGVEWVPGQHRVNGVLRTDAYVLEIELPVGPVDHIVLTLHGEEAVDAARSVLELLDASAVDLETDLVIDVAGPASRRHAQRILDSSCSA